MRKHLSLSIIGSSNLTDFPEASEKSPLSSIDWMMIMWTFQFDLNEAMGWKGGKVCARYTSSQAPET